MAANESNNKSKKNDGNNAFICPIKYNVDLPDPQIGCKFLPCGKTLMDYTTEPVSFPQLETQFDQKFKGLHLLFEIDLLGQKTYEPNEGEPVGMDPRDAALLADIEPLHINNPKPKAVHSFPTRAQECRELFAKERSSVPRPRAGLQQMQPEKPQLEMETLSLEQQKQLIHQTFVDIERPLGRHPTKANSNARPIAVLPIFPHPSQHEFVHFQFGIPPSESSCGLLKDCGHYLINFKANPDKTAETNVKGLQTFISDQRYKEERTSENAERGEPMILREMDGSYYYQMVNRHIKLRKERPNVQSNNTLCLLQVTCDKL
ncbi:hypothetical protein ACLKA7_002662 [Drosophila subpalustris]